MKIQRREFLRLLGGVSGAIALGGFGIDEMIDVPDELVEQVKRGKGIETWKNTICRRCPGGCGLSVRLIDDVPIMVKGNPMNPISLGGICPLGRSSIGMLFNPDRLKQPVRHVGSPGDGHWEEISWDEALNMINEALSTLRREKRTEELVCLGSDESAFEQQHIDRFMQAFGSPNYYRFADDVFAGAAHEMAEGTRTLPAYDTGNADVILSVGANYLEEGYAPVYHTKVFSRSRDREDGSRARIIHADARLNLSASNADQWVPIKPGTYASFALGIAHVLIRDNLYDASFVDKRTVGFDDWKDARGVKHAGFKSIVMDSYHPAKVGELTGIPSETIESIAREVGHADHAIILGDQGLRSTTDGTTGALAVHALNVLLGNLGKKGGVVRPSDVPFASFASVKPDSIAREGIKALPIGRSTKGDYPAVAFSPDELINNAGAQDPYPVSVLFLFGGNPLFSSIRHHDFESLLRNTPLTVSFDVFQNETNANADLILPASTFLESWGVVDSVPTVPMSYVGVQQPVIAPFYESRTPADVLIDIANRLDDSVSAAYPYKTLKETIKNQTRGLFESGTGMIASESAGEFWSDRSSRPNHTPGRERSFDSFWKKLVDRGGWWNPDSVRYEKPPVFHTSSRKYDLTTAHLLETGAHSETIESDGYDLNLITFQTLTHRDGRGANDRMLQEMMGQAVRCYWNTWVEMSPVTAADNDIQDGDWVWIESRQGAVRVQAKIHEGIVPNTVAIPFGMGHTNFGQNADGFGENPNAIMAGIYDRLGGTPATQSTLVRIKKRA